MTRIKQINKGYAKHKQDRIYFEGGVAPALAASNFGHDIKVTLKDMRVRKLTPRECFRLQGFPDELFDKAASVNSDSQLYKQAGNSVTVNVVYEIAKRLKQYEDKSDE